MSVVVTIEEYCANPSAYVNKLSDFTRKYYDGICKAKQELSNIPPPSKGEQIGEAIAKLPTGMIESFLTPSGLEMLGIFMGIEIAPKLLAGGVLRAIGAGIGKSIADVTAELAAEEGGSYFLANNALMIKVLSNAAEEGSAAAFAITAVEAITTSLDVIGVILLIVQLLTAVLDAFDIGGWNEEMDAKSLQHIVDTMNSAFAEGVLSKLSTAASATGTKVIFRQWPLEYYADLTILPGAVGAPSQDLCVTKEKCSYDTILEEAAFEYLGSLRFNSNGYPIVWPKGGRLLNESDFQKLADHVDYIISDQNVIVALWIKRWWIVILVVVILLVIFILAIR